MIFAELLVAALVLAPGLGAALAFARPGTVSVEARVALAFGLGYGLVAGIAILLALAHVLFLGTFVAGVVIATVASWAGALRRSSLREHWSDVAAQARERPFSILTTLGLLVTVFVVWSLHPAAANLAHRPAWRYWADGLEIAAAGHVPPEAHQWGIQIPTTVSKVVLNAFEGGLSFLLGPDPMRGMQAILVVAAVGFVAGLAGTARELGLQRSAPVVPALAILAIDRLDLGTELSSDLTRFTAENVGRMAAFGGLVAAICALRSGLGRVSVGAAGLLLAVAALTHGVPTFVACVMFALYAITLAFLERTRARTILLRAALLAGVLGVAYVGVIGLSGGDLGFQRAGSASLDAFPPDVDPTQSFSSGKMVAPAPREDHFLVSPRELVRGYAQATLGRSQPPRRSAALLVALALGSVLVVVRRGRPLVPVTVVAWGLLVTIVAAAFYFSFRYSTLIPGVFGIRRLYDYAPLVSALLLGTMLEAITAGLAVRTRLVTRVVGAAVAAFCLAAVLSNLPRDRSLRPAHAGEAVIDHIAAVVPCGARMVANARTAGTWEATTGRGAVTEGMAPFLRPAVLERVLPILVGANEFFADPQAHRRFLAEQRIDYLVVIEPKVWFGWGGTGRAPHKRDAARVASLPDVHPVVQDRWVTIFAVGSPDAPAGAQPRRCPL